MVLRTFYHVLWSMRSRYFEVAQGEAISETFMRPELICHIMPIILLCAFHFPPGIVCMYGLERALYATIRTSGNKLSHPYLICHISHHSFYGIILSLSA